MQRLLGWAVPVVVLVTGCFPSPNAPDAGTCVYPGQCRPGLICKFDGQCVPACTAAESTPCATADGGPGAATCRPESGWSRCETAPCELGMTQACQLTATEMGERICQLDGTLSACAAIPCVPGPPQQCANSDAGVTVRVCQADAGFSACFTAPCTQSISCPVAPGDGGAALYGERACLADGGYDLCRENSQCSIRVGVCAQARRLFTDPDAGCGESSYQALPTWQAAETCPGDDLDNDCDGETDEVGPTVVLAEGATEVAAIGEFTPTTNEPGRYRVLLVMDGGITFTRLSDSLQPVTAPSQQHVLRTDGGRLEPRFTRRGAPNTLVSWVEDRGVVFSEQPYNTLGPLLPWSFATEQPPLFAQAALIRNKPVVAVFYDAPLTDGGVARTALVAQPSDGGFSNVTCSTSDAVCFPYIYDLVGWSGDLAMVAVQGFVFFLSTNPADRDRQADGGMNDGGRLSDGGLPDTVFFEPAPSLFIREVRGANHFPSAFALAAEPPAFAVSFVLDSDIPGSSRFGTLDSTATPNFAGAAIPFAQVSGASAVVRSLDGGPAVLTAFTVDGGVALTPLSKNAGVRWISAPNITGKALLAWSYLSPNKALLTMPVKAADGGSQVIGRQLCMPEWVP